MFSYIVRRLVLLIPTLFGISVFVFLMIHLTPGDPARVMLGERATPEALEALRRDLGLDAPWYVQYGRFLADILRGELGRSIKTGERIRVEIGQHFPATIELAVMSMLFATLAGMIAGVLSATHRYSLLDYLSMIGALVGISMPIFWLGLMLILFFSIKLQWLPISGRLNPEIFFPVVTNFYLVDSLLAKDWSAFLDALRHLLIPAMTLGTIPLAIIARMTRSSMLEVLREDYIRTAEAKGLNTRRIHYKHALRNALIPVVTVTGLQFGYLLGGAILTETIFAWPGVGRWLLLAVYARDFRAVQGGTLVVATFFVLINLLVDLLYAYIDPRIRYS